MRSVAHYVKCQAEIRRSDFVPLVVDDVSHTEKAGFGVLPVLNKPFQHRHETRSAEIADLSALQHETRDHRYREIELFTIVPATARHIRPAQILQIGNHAARVIDAIEKSGRQAP